MGALDARSEERRRPPFMGGWKKEEAGAF